MSIMESTHRRIFGSLRQNRMFMSCLELHISCKDLLLRDSWDMKILRPEAFSTKLCLATLYLQQSDSKKSHNLPPPRSILCKSRILELILVSFSQFFFNRSVLCHFKTDPWSFAALRISSLVQIQLIGSQVVAGYGRRTVSAYLPPLRHFQNLRLITSDCIYSRHLLNFAKAS